MKITDRTQKGGIGGQAERPGLGARPTPVTVRGQNPIVSILTNLQPIPSPNQPAAGHPNAKLVVEELTATGRRAASQPVPALLLK
jgi:hypothetical protein